VEDSERKRKHKGKVHWMNVELRLFLQILEVAATSWRTWTPRPRMISDLAAKIGTHYPNKHFIPNIPNINIR
jgi:hypothetical protein